MGKFMNEELAIAKAVDLVNLAESVGVHLRKKENYYQAKQKNARENSLI